MAEKISLEKVVAVLPTLDEEQGVKLVVQGLQKEGVREIIVVDGGSADATAKVARESGAVVIRQRDKGKGNAFKTFLSSYPIDEDAVYATLDADATYLPEDLQKLVEEIGKGAEVASGKRAMLVYDLRSLVHSVGGRLFSLFASLLFFKWHPDVSTGYWAFSGRALKKINVTAEGFDLETNFFVECAKKNLRLSVVPVSYQKRVGVSKYNSFDALKILGWLLRYRFS